MSALRLACALIAALALAAAGWALTHPAPATVRIVTAATTPTAKPAARLAPEESVFRQVAPLRTRARRAQSFAANFYRSSRATPKGPDGVPAANLLAAAAGNGGRTDVLTTVYKADNVLACRRLTNPDGWACLVSDLRAGRHREVVELSPRVGEARHRAEARARALLVSRKPAT